MYALIERNFIYGTHRKLLPKIYKTIGEARISAILYRDDTLAEMHDDGNEVYKNDFEDYIPAIDIVDDSIHKIIEWEVVKIDDLY